MEIVKVTYDDGSESVFEKKPLEYFKEKYNWRPEYHFKNQIKDFEEDNIFPNLRTDLEDWAKDQYNLVDEKDVKEIDDFSDYDLMKEFKDRNLKDYYEFQNQNITNEDFISRFVKIVDRGDDSAIDSALETLEKCFHIK